ncbi:MAG: hypothetical protein ACOCWT_04975, partial [Desulfohalobiaceae bacterium]
MSKAWIRSKRPEFARDVLRDFCLIHQQLDREFGRYDQTGNIDFYFLRDLLGEEMNKGLLWHLKDTAHLLFRNDSKVPVVGQLLDWGLGYIFHECIKLKEDAYQKQNYSPWFQAVQADHDLTPEERLISQELFQLISQTRESIAREVKRIRFILYHCRRMFTFYLPAHSDNALLARFLFDQDILVRDVFKGGYDALVEAIYADNPSRLYVLAARSLRQGGWIRDASRAVSLALDLDPTGT